jgi:hypothetical protein
LHASTSITTTTLPPPSSSSSWFVDALLPSGVRCRGYVDASDVAAAADAAVDVNGVHNATPTTTAPTTMATTTTTTTTTTSTAAAAVATGAAAAMAPQWRSSVDVAAAKYVVACVEYGAWAAQTPAQRDAAAADVDAAQRMLQQCSDNVDTLLAMHALQAELYAH